MKKIAFFIAIIISLSFSIMQKKKTTIWMIGDSTMAVKEKKYYPETGWGMPFVQFWDSTVTIENRAKNGRSTKSFLKENLWKPVFDELQEGDYVFIQFGHNDEIPTKQTATSPAEFKENLEKYVNETRAKKAIPVLLTSVARRKFDSTGVLVDTHQQYAAITTAVARQMDVLLIDVNKSSMELLKQMGPQSSAYLFNHLSPGEHPNYPEGKTDDTHFNELGARRMAELVFNDIRHSNLELKTRIVVPAVKK